MARTNFLSTTQLAKILGISRIAVWKKIKSGEIPAKKIGRNYLIEKNDLGILKEEVTEKEAQLVKKSVKKTVKEYGETLRLLGAS